MSLQRAEDRRLGLALIKSKARVCAVKVRHAAVSAFNQGDAMHVKWLCGRFRMTDGHHLREVRDRSVLLKMVLKKVVMAAALTSSSTGEEEAWVRMR